MLTLFGSKERTLSGWIKVINEADQRFEVRCQISGAETPTNVIGVTLGSG